MKLAICKELNYFEHYDILEYIENKQLNFFLNKVGIFSALELHHYNNTDLYVLIHPCPKVKNKFQVSYFDKNGPISDAIYVSLKDCVKSVFHIYSKIYRIVR